MRKILLIVIIPIILILLFSIVYTFYIRISPKYAKYPASPTTEQREDAKKTLKEDCICWNIKDNYCHPIADCI